MNKNHSNKFIKGILEDTKSMAIVGASSNRIVNEIEVDQLEDIAHRAGVVCS